uniref:Serpentine receptor class gamma n=1 Tax=Haemonchus contortus TaxID=6289 RepID=A0A7I4YNY4_HAECO
MIGNTFIAFNRYSSICFMYTYDKIWTRRNVLVIVAVQYAVSIAAVSYNVTSKIVYVQVDNGSYEFQGLEPHVATITGCIFSTLVYVCTLTSFGLNVRLYIERRKLLKEGILPASRHAEKGLLIYTITAFISMVVMCAVDGLFAVASATHNHELLTWANDHVSWINDCTISVPPLFLLLLSPDLRRAVLSIFRTAKPPTFVKPFSHTLNGG